MRLFTYMTRTEGQSTMDSTALVSLCRHEFDAYTRWAFYLTLSIPTSKGEIYHLAKRAEEHGRLWCHLQVGLRCRARRPLRERYVLSTFFWRSIPNPERTVMHNPA